MVSTTLIPNIGVTMFTPEFIFAMAIVPRGYMKKKTIEEKIAKLEELCAVQCSDGNWNHSPYMHGMANGIIFALSVLNDETPEYLDRPEYFSSDLTELDKFNNSPIIATHEREEK